MDEHRQYLINEDIEQYKAEVFKGLTVQQVKNALIVAAVAIISFLFLDLVCYVPLTLASLMTIFTSVPVVIMTFFKVEGMDMKEFISRFWIYEFGGGYVYKGDTFRQYDELAGYEAISDKSAENHRKTIFRKKKAGTDGEEDEEKVTYLAEHIRRELLAEKYKAAKALLLRMTKEGDDMGFSDELEKFKNNLQNESYKEPGRSDNRRPYAAEQMPDNYRAELKADISGDDISEETQKAPPGAVFIQNEQQHDAVVRQPEQMYTDNAMSQVSSENRIAAADREELYEEYEETAVLSTNIKKSRVCCLKEEATGKSHILGNYTTIGRSKKSDIVIKDNNTVSSNHAVIMVNGESVLIKDVGSRNGTFIDGKRIQEGFDIAVRPDSELKFSNAVFRLEVLGGNDEV